MTSPLTHQDIENLLSEADKLIRKINDDPLHDMQEEQRLQVEKEAQTLKQLRSETREKLDREQKPESGAIGEGMHEAIDAIAKAVKNIGGFLS